jgi:hypothetical protein
VLALLDFMETLMFACNVHSGACRVRSQRIVQFVEEIGVDSHANARLDFMMTVPRQTAKVPIKLYISKLACLFKCNSCENGTSCTTCRGNRELPDCACKIGEFDDQISLLCSSIT